MSDNRIDSASTLQHQPRINGQRNRVLIGSNTRFHAHVSIDGDDNEIVVGNWCVIHGSINIVRVNGARIAIGSAVTAGEGASFQVHERADITIGNECMFANRTMITVSDMHPIYDAETGELLNPGASVIVEPHVWLGLGALVLKGVRIGTGAMIGAGSIVTRDIPAHAMAAGNPSRVIRKGIRWEREFKR